MRLDPTVALPFAVALACHAPTTSPGTAPAVAQDSATRLQVRVDPRVELFSMLWRTAGIPPYAPQDEHRTPYEAAVDARMAPLRSHPAVQQAEALAESKGIGFDAPMSLAVHLSWPELELVRPLQPWPASLDDRWQGVDMDAWLSTVRAFASDARLAEFFAEQRPLWDRVDATMAAFVQAHGADAPQWLHEFSGTAIAQTVLVQGLLTERGNYGPHVVLPDGRKTAYQIIVNWHPDEDGVPRPQPDLAVFYIHELAHSYMNPLVERHASILQASAQALYDRHAAAMEAVGYGEWYSVACESLVRAATRTYLHDDPEAAAGADENDRLQGFAWVPEVAAVLEPPLDETDMTAVAQVLARHGAP